MPDSSHCRGKKNLSLPHSARTFVLHPGDEIYYKELGRRVIRAYKDEYGEISYYLANAAFYPCTQGNAAAKQVSARTSSRFLIISMVYMSRG
jgi:hypothetical protein